VSVLADDKLFGLVTTLRDHGLAISSPKHVDFLNGVTRLTLNSIDDLYWIGRVTLVARAEDLDVYDGVFHAWFHDTIVKPIEEIDTDDYESETPSVKDRSERELESINLGEGTGLEASVHDLTGRRTFQPTSAEARLLCTQIGQVARRDVPRERTRRLRPARNGRVLDIRRVLRSATRSGGEILSLAYRRAPNRARKLLVLIDVSGSLKVHSPDFLRFAHALVNAADRVQVYTFGTRLTRVTNALRHEDVDRALSGLSDVVFDLDGGTRIGASISEFLGSGRRRNMACGAVVVVLSDGLERGDPQLMVAGVERLARLSHRIVWLTPLASGPAYVPRTKAMMAVAPSLDRLGSSASLDDLLAELSNLVAVSAGARRSCQHQTEYRLDSPSISRERIP
jgi:uncharacterized protein with von Willebrand factor type A (vWA) domain